ncbi:MAG: hypothetical protein FWD40_01370 [Treponema sp.]|nr:hypothetical protein [Treponema sp.]
MKKNIFFLLLILSVTVLICISCASTPDAPGAGGATAPESSGVYTHLVGVSTMNAEAARRRGIDFTAPDYFPSDWESVESQFSHARSMPESTDDEVIAAAAALDAVAHEYDVLFWKTTPLYAQAREDEIMEHREHIVHSGFSGVFPQYLKKADDIALASKAQYDAGAYYNARDLADEALVEYETLHLGSRVYAARQEIVDRGFIEYDPENFLRADEIARSALTAYEAGNRETATANAEEALLRYNIVRENGWTSYASVRRDGAVKERELALEERANVASRETYREAEVSFNRAEENLAARNFTAAGLAYIDAEAMFAISRKETVERRQRAEEAIRQAEEKIGESSESAVEAERIIEGGSR